MTAETTDQDTANEAAAAAGLTRAQQRTILWWEVGAFVFIMLVGSFFHFIYELSGFHPFAALFGSVNESSWEHLKLFFYPGLVFFLVQHAFVKEFANNYWYGKALALAITPIGVLVSFYFYLGIVLPIWGEGTLALDIGTGAFGVLMGNVVAYRTLTQPPRTPSRNWIGVVAMAVMTVAFLTLTYFPPKFFIFEDFLGYEYRGEWGILEDYSEHLVFTEE
jgi:hypothetical protein